MNAPVPLRSLRLLRGPEVDQRRGRQKSQRAEDVAVGTLTPALKLAPRVAVWPEHEIDQILAAEIAGASRDQLRELVTKLVGQRATFLPALLQAA